MTQVIIGFFGQQGGVTAPEPGTQVGSFKNHNDTNSRALTVQQFTAPMPEGAVTVGDLLWTSEGEFVQWEPLSTEEGEPRLHPDGSPMFIKGYAKVLANARQIKTIPILKDNTLTPPSFEMHENVQTALGNLLQISGRSNYTGSFDLYQQVNGTHTYSLRNADKQVVNGPVMSMIRVKDRDPNDSRLFHEWWIKVYSGLPYIDVIVWSNVSNVSLAQPTFALNSMIFRVVQGEAVWKGNGFLWDSQATFDYAGTNYKPYANNVVLSEGQPIVRARGQVFFYDTSVDDSALTPDEQDTLFSFREQGQLTGTNRSFGCGWKQLDAWGPPGKVVDRPVWIATDPLAYNFAVQEARQYYPGGEGLSYLQRHHLARGRLSANYQPAATGWAPGFGIMNFQALAYTECPLYLFGMENATDFEVARPIFLRQANGDFLSRDNEPSMGIWEGQPFSHSNMSTGGGTTGVNRSSPARIPSTLSRANPLPNGDVFAIQVFGYDEQHWVLTIPHHFLASGDELAGRLIDHHRQSLRMHLNTPSFPNSVPGVGISPVFGEPYNPRGEGRSIGSAAWIEFVSPNDDFREAIDQHVLTMLNAWDVNGGLRNKPFLGQNYGTVFAQAEAGNADMASWSIFEPTGLQLDVDQMLTWEDGMAEKALQWIAVTENGAVETTLRRLFKTISYVQVDNWWFFQGANEANANGTEDQGWHLIQSIPAGLNSGFGYERPPQSELPPNRPWWGAFAGPPNANTGYEDTGVDRYQIPCPYPNCSGYPQSRFKIARDGLTIWSLNVVYFAYQQALAEGRTATADKARQILNVYKAGHNQGPNQFQGILGGWWPEVSASIGIWLYNPDMTGDPLTLTL